MKTTGSRILCYIMTVLLLMFGMCQSKVEADFCFPCTENGQVGSFMAADDGRVDSYELSRREILGLKETALAVREVRQEGRRLISRFLIHLLQTVVILFCTSVFLRTVEVRISNENSCTEVIIHYLHEKDGKK